MISMSPDDRDALRFLSVDNPHSDNPNTAVYRFARVVFVLSSTPYLLNVQLDELCPFQVRTAPCMSYLNSHRIVPFTIPFKIIPFTAA